MRLPCLHISFIVELIGHIILIGFLRQELVRPSDGAVSAFPCWRKYDFSAEGLKDVLSFGADTLRHKKFDPISFCSADHS